jgi:hypothetical protein
MYVIRCVDTSLQVPVFVMFPRYSYAPYLWASVTAHGAGAPGIRPGEMEPTDHQSVLCGDPGAVPEEWVRFLQPWGPVMPSGCYPRMIVWTTRIGLSTWFQLQPETTRVINIRLHWHIFCLVVCVFVFLIFFHIYWEFHHPNWLLKPPPSDDGWKTNHPHASPRFPFLAGSL